jgi:hypothetical protein
MLSLELATTEQIITELAKRPIDFSLICVPLGEQQADEGYIAFSPHLSREAVRSMLERAGRILAQDDLDSPFNCDRQDQDLDFE